MVNHAAYPLGPAGRHQILQVHSFGILQSCQEVEKAKELLAFLNEDSQNLAAENLHELMRAWESIHRMYQAEAHVRTLLFREETRWPGYYFRGDCPKLDEENWKCFVNCTYDAAKGSWEMKKRPILNVFKPAQDHELVGG